MGEKEIKRKIYSESIGEAESGVTNWTVKTAILMMPDQKVKCQICQNIYSGSSFKCSCLMSMKMS